MSRQWKPGDVALRADQGRAFCTGLTSGAERQPMWAAEGIGLLYERDLGNARPLVVIDPAALVDGVTPGLVADIVFAQATQLEREEPTATKSIAVLHALANAIDDVVQKPKPYREHAGGLAPWPVVGECHSYNDDGHECPQCAWVHEHDWVAWTGASLPEWPPNATPIRCSKCGGRKCDLDACPEQRHQHDHQGGAQ